VGHQIKVGNSSRLYIVSGPLEDVEEESSESVTELRQRRLDKELERKRMEAEIRKEEEEEELSTGISWGIGTSFSCLLLQKCV